MTDRKKKAIDYLNSRKVKREVMFWFQMSALAIGIVIALIFALIEIIK